MDCISSLASKAHLPTGNPSPPSPSLCGHCRIVCPTIKDQFAQPSDEYLLFGPTTPSSLQFLNKYASRQTHKTRAQVHSAANCKHTKRHANLPMLTAQK